MSSGHDVEHEEHHTHVKHALVRHGSFRSLDLDFPNEKKEVNHGTMFDLMSQYLGTSADDVKHQIANHIAFTLARSRYNFDDYSAYQATALSLRDRMIELWNDTQQNFTVQRKKRVYYLSIEYLIGRSMQNAVVNLGLQDPYSLALKDFGYQLEELYEHEHDAALGNGGLGRLAACFLDSLATQNYAGWGYGIRYQYGMLRQEIRNGYQVETPDFWLRNGNPWEIQRSDVTYDVRFGGTAKKENGKWVWEGGEVVIAMAYDTPIPGYGTTNTLNLRLWASAPRSEFDLTSFNAADYYNALKANEYAQSITSVLYPNDKTRAGKILRLQQQYFFCSASLRDIIRRLKKTKTPLKEMPSMAAIQLNDTHPVIAIPELMRILIDEEGFSYDESWRVVNEVFAFTNHTVLPEALEKWPVDIWEELLPRHLQIVYEINHFFILEVQRRFPGDAARLARVSIVEEGNPKQLRMANLAIIASFSVNGVAKIHTDIIKSSIFKDFYQMFPHRFNNKTNGVTPRRWIMSANPALAQLYTEHLKSDDWVRSLSLVSGLRGLATQTTFQEKFAAIKQNNKNRLTQLILKATAGQLVINPKALFDIHVKRIHEYKRQLMNILSVIARYLWIKELTPEEQKHVVPRVVIFAGKAAPGYHAAKLVIKIINSVAHVINADVQLAGLLKVVFIPNYNVSVCEVLVPAADISQHISTAGTEASGTSNMKFSMNGGLILGTMDGANIEIREEAGPDAMFSFGATAEEVDAIRAATPGAIDERLHAALHALKDGQFGEYELFRGVIDPLWHGNDYYLIAHDFVSYLETQDQVDSVWKNKPEWLRRCIVTSTSSGKFSSDTSIHAYAQEIWGIQPTPPPPQAQTKSN